MSQHNRMSGEFDDHEDIEQPLGVCDRCYARERVWIVRVGRDRTRRNACRTCAEEHAQMEAARRERKKRARR